MGEILYKYRSLAGSEDFKNFVDIILYGRLYAAHFRKLNDPMEGHYYSRACEKALHKKLKNDKENVRICSLSKTKDNEILWSHYANESKGVAIGVEVNLSSNKLRNIEYKDEKFFIQNQDYDKQAACEILSYKLKIWEHEKEIRAFVPKKKKFIEVTVKEVIIGRRMKKDDYNRIKEFVKKINQGIKVYKSRKKRAPMKPYSSR